MTAGDTAILADLDRDAAFRREGYVELPLLDPAELAALRQGYARLRPDDGFAPAGTGGRASYHCSFVDTNREFRREVFALLTRLFERHVERLFNGYRIVTANFYVKPPGRGMIFLHQNWPLLADLDETSVTLWCPLQDTEETNGTLALIPRSHKLVPHVETPGAPGYFAGIQKHVWRRLQPVDVRAGHAVLFDDSLLHGSKDNLSAQPRVAVQLMCAPGDAPIVFYVPQRDGRFELIEAGSDFFVDHTDGEVKTRQPHWRHAGYAPNRNRPLSLREFDRLMAARGVRPPSRLRAWLGR
jgi:hypothetical protein